MRLEHGSLVFGWFTMSVPNLLAKDLEAQTFFTDLCRNIGRALWTIAEEQQRKAVEQQYATIIDSTTDAVIATDLEGNITLFSPGAEKLFECSAAYAIGRNISIFSPPNKIKEQQECLKALIRKGTTARYITERVSLSGKSRMTEIVLTMQGDESGQPTTINGILRDITDRMRMEEALKDSELRYQRIVRILPQLVCYIDKNYIIRHSNRNGLSLEGNRQNIQNKPVHAILGQPAFQLIKKHLDKAFTGERIRYRDKIVSLSGQKYNVDCWLVPDRTPAGEIPGIYAVIHDVTQIAETKEALRETSNKMRAIFRAAPVGIGVVSNRTFIEVNDRFCDITGYSQKELLGQNARIVYPSDEEYEFVGSEKYRQIAEQGTGEVETRMRHKNGTILDVLMNSTPLNPADLSQGVTFTVLNITKRKQAENHLKAQQRAISMHNAIANVFLMSPPDRLFKDVLAVILKNLDSRYGCFGYLDHNGDLICPSMTDDAWQDCSFSHCKKIRLSDELGEILTKSIQEKQTLAINHRIRTPADQTDLQCALAAPIIHRDQVIGQYVVANKPGGYTSQDRHLLESGACQTAPILYAYLKEEERQREHIALEEQYRQSQKLESIGRLAGGVAHDLNNLLSPILGYGEILVEDLNADDPRRDSAHQIVNAGQRAAELVRQLLAFSRKQSLEFKDIDLNSLLKNFQKLLRRTIREDISLIIETQDQLPRARGDIGQLEQVVMNLAINAQDAMAAGGILRIETSLVTVDNSSIPQQGLDGINPGVYICLTIADNGAGMDRTTLSHIFEPFFTTKGQNEGTGLGLATVYGIIKQHNGHIRVNSQIGSGTTFTILIPVARASRNVAQEMEQQETVPGGDETILLVEDNMQMRALAQTALQRKGYKVLTAANGSKAFDIAEQYSGPIDLLLTDVIMPDLNGRQVYETLAQSRPGLKVLYMSGYTRNVILPHGVTAQSGQFIQKPFSIHKLMEKVRQILADTQPTH